VQESPHLNTRLLGNLPADSALQTLDFKVADYRKMLNKLR
jgi:hypothetical protein